METLFFACFDRGDYLFCQGSFDRYFFSFLVDYWAFLLICWEVVFLGGFVFAVFDCRSVALGSAGLR